MIRRLLAVALLVAGCGASSASHGASPGPTPAAIPSVSAATSVPALRTVTGVLSIPGFTNVDPTECKANDGYEDVGVGTDVVIKDESETTVGVDRLELWADAPDSAYFNTDNGVGKFPCLFRYSIDVPEASFYSITIGRRDGPTISSEDLAAQDWQWDLSLGLD